MQHVGYSTTSRHFCHACCPFVSCVLLVRQRAFLSGTCVQGVHGLTLHTEHLCMHQVSLSYIAHAIHFRDPDRGGYTKINKLLKKLAFRNFVQKFHCTRLFFILSTIINSHFDTFYECVFFLILSCAPD